MTIDFGNIDGWKSDPTDGLDEDELKIYHRINDIIKELDSIDDEVSTACDFYHAYMDMTKIGLKKAQYHIRG
jgi:hypothetical protein